MSSTASGMTMTRTSRPACIAKTFSTPGKSGRDLLDALEPLDIELEAFAARPGRPPLIWSAAWVEHRADGARLDLVVVRLDRVDDVLVLAVAAGDLGADQRVAALVLMVERLADVVQQRAALGGRRQAHLGGHDPGQMGRLDRVPRTFWP